MPTPELNKALAAFQADLPKIPKNAKGEIRGVTKDGKPYSYQFDYASLEDVTDETLPALGRHGLSLTGAVTTDDQGRIVYEYTLLHESGEERGPKQFPLWLLLPERFTAQTIGGYITYARRYIVGPVTGIAPGGQDIDATGAEEAAPHTRPRVKTAHTDPEHQRLQPRRTPDDRPAERGPLPRSQDPWDGQEPGEFEPGETSLPDRRRKPMTPAQLIRAHWKRLGITDDDEAHIWTAKMAGRTELASTNNLPPEQQQEILSALAQSKDIGKVQEWIDEKAGAS